MLLKPFDSLHIQALIESFQLEREVLVLLVELLLDLLKVNLLVLIVEVRGEPGCREILNVLVKDIIDRYTLLLKYEEEIHQFVFSLLAIVQFRFDFSHTRL